MFNTIKLFLIKYWLRIKRKLNQTVANIRLLHYINTISAENLSYTNTEQAVNKTNYIHIHIYSHQ